MARVRYSLSDGFYAQLFNEIYVTKRWRKRCDLKMSNLGLFSKSMLVTFWSRNVDSTVLPLRSRLMHFLFNYLHTFCVRKYISYSCFLCVFQNRSTRFTCSHVDQKVGEQRLWPVSRNILPNLSVDVFIEINYYL